MRGTQGLEHKHTMSLKNLNNPPLVALAGAGISIGLPMLNAALSSSASLTLLKSLNVAAFATNGKYYIMRVLSPHCYELVVLNICVPHALLCSFF